ncbi:MAG: hypothetical protein KDE47_29595, partial [Caldilineaceae bacterium]|nr:hypothetical protein [Caldilineaceae bacterium]
PTATPTASPTATVDNATSTPTPVVANVLINEVDANSTGSDTAEFVELYGTPGAALDGLCLLALNGSNDRVYLTVDLDGGSLNGNGFFVVGNPGVANVGLTFADNTLQNGPDAVAIVGVEECDATISSSTTVTDVRAMTLVDAVVYATNDDDDVELLSLLNPGQPQVDEDASGDGDGHANARCPNGGGGPRNTSSFVQLPPSPGTANDCSAFPTPTPTVTPVNAP